MQPWVIDGLRVVEFSEPEPSTPPMKVIGIWRPTAVIGMATLQISVGIWLSLTFRMLSPLKPEGPLSAGVLMVLAENERW